MQQNMDAALHLCDWLLQIGSFGIPRMSIILAENNAGLNGHYAAGDQMTQKNQPIFLTERSIGLMHNYRIIKTVGQWIHHSRLITQ